MHGDIYKYTVTFIMRHDIYECSFTFSIYKCMRHL